MFLKKDISHFMTSYAIFRADYVFVLLSIAWDTSGVCFLCDLNLCPLKICVEH